MLSQEMFRNRISFDNPWWESGRIAADYQAVAPRSFLDTVYRHLTDWSLRRAILLLGPRRVGKTWLMQHTVGRLLETEFLPAKHIIFISIDVPVYHGSTLEELVREAAQVNGIDMRSERLVVFFDEIQYLKDWELHLKTLTEGYANIRFMASGSATSALAKGSVESGAGRFTDLRLPPLSFHEFMGITGKGAELGDQSLVTSEGSYAFPSAPSLERLNGQFLEYLNYGGYPELASSLSVRADPTQFVQHDIVDKVLLRDLPSLYHIEDVRDLQGFFSYLAFHTGMLQSWETLAQGSGLRKAKVMQLLGYLESAFLVARHDRIDISAARLQRATQFKVYLTNASLRASMFQPIFKPDDPFIGNAVETAVSSQLGIGSDRSAWRYAHWKIGRTEGEVDFVRLHSGTLRPDVALEVKWSDGPFDHPAELKGAIEFCTRNGLRQLWVTTRSQQGVRKMGDLELVYVPTALFAYQLGRTGVFK